MRGPTAPDPAHQFDVERYDKWCDRPWGRYASGSERRALGRFNPTDARGTLDEGCGTGRLAFGTASGTVIGVDHDLEMLKLAQRRRAGSVLQADANHLPFTDGTFDVSTTVTLCEFTESAAAPIAELARVTRIGGQLVIDNSFRAAPGDSLIDPGSALPRGPARSGSQRRR